MHMPHCRALQSHNEQPCGVDVSGKDWLCQDHHNEYRVLTDEYKQASKEAEELEYLVTYIRLKDLRSYKDIDAVKRDKVEVGNYVEKLQQAIHGREVQHRRFFPTPDASHRDFLDQLKAKLGQANLLMETLDREESVLKVKEERRILEEHERTAARSAERLKPIVDDIGAEGGAAYIRIGDVRKDERVVRLYLDSLDEQIDAARALRTVAISESAADSHCGSQSLDQLEGRKAKMVALLAALEKEARRLELEQEQRTASDSGGSVPTLDEPPAYPVLDTPHPLHACAVDSSDTSKDPDSNGQPGRCTAIESWGECTRKCTSEHRFCSIHRILHETDVDNYKRAVGWLEAQRVQIMQGEGENLKSHRVKGVRKYLDKLEGAMKAVEEHQRRFSCRGADSHTELLDDLRKRQTMATLLLGELSGRTDGRDAENQGRAETWATQFLTEVKQKEALERRRMIEDVVIGLTVSGVSSWLGVPWARSMITGAVTSFVVRLARDREP